MFASYSLELDGYFWYAYAVLAKQTQVPWTLLLRRIRHFSLIWSRMHGVTKTGCFCLNTN